MGLTILIIALALLAIAVLVIAFLSARNTLARQRNELGKAWAALDQLLKQRRDELPRLIGTCRSYLSDGSALLDAVAAARAAEQKAFALPEKARAARELGEALARLFAAGDRNSALALDASYRQLKKLLAELGETIAAEQTRFNQQARAFNTRLNRPWTRLTARAASVERQAMFDARDVRRA